MKIALTGEPLNVLLSLSKATDQSPQKVMCKLLMGIKVVPDVKAQTEYPTEEKN